MTIFLKRQTGIVGALWFGSFPVALVWFEGRKLQFPTAWITNIKYPCKKLRNSLLTSVENFLILGERSQNIQETRRELHISPNENVNSRRQNYVQHSVGSFFSTPCILNMRKWLSHMTQKCEKQGCIFFPKIEFFINHYLKALSFLWSEMPISG